MTENKRFNCHVKFSAMPNGIMVLDYERHGDEQTVIEDISREKAHRVMDRLNELNDENEQLKSDLKSYQNMVKQYINLHIDKIRRRYVNPTKEEVAERTRIIRDLEQLKKELSE